MHVRASATNLHCFGSSSSNQQRRSTGKIDSTEREIECHLLWAKRGWIMINSKKLIYLIIHFAHNFHFSLACLQMRTHSHTLAHIVSKIEHLISLPYALPFSLFLFFFFLRLFHRDFCSFYPLPQRYLLQMFFEFFKQTLQRINAKYCVLSNPAWNIVLDFHVCIFKWLFVCERCVWNEK